MANQHKHAQAFPLAATLIGIAMAICVVSFFVKALLVRHQVVQGGDRIKHLERALAEVNAKNEAFLSKKNDLTSVPALRAAMASGFLKLQAIDERFVITVAQPRPAVAAATTLEGR